MSRRGRAPKVRDALARLIAACGPDCQPAPHVLEAWARLEAEATAPRPDGLAELADRVRKLELAEGVRRMSSAGRAS